MVVLVGAARGVVVVPVEAVPREAAVVAVEDRRGEAQAAQEVQVHHRVAHLVQVSDFTPQRIHVLQA